MTALRPMEMLSVEPTSTTVSVEVDVDRATGSASVQIPIPLTAGRDGHGPGLALSFGGYDPLSPFPHGWSLSGLPSIDIDTRDGLPRYDGTDRYRFLGQELVPLDDAIRPTQWVRDGHDVRAFRARIETAPLRVERWTDQASGRIHWRVRTPDGAVQVFGRRADGESRIADPSEARRTFRWLLESAFDRLGNAVVVRYQAEDGVGVDSASLDAQRFVAATANRYPKRILYGNAAPFSEGDDTSSATWFFEVVFDYGEHDPATPQPTPAGTWPVRTDVGFAARLGFESRTRRLCRRVLMFHHFPDELGEPSTLVGSFEFDIDQAPEASTLTGVRYVGWRTELGSRISRSTPWASFEYTDAGTEDAFEVFEVPALGTATHLVDLFSEGLPGLLTRDTVGNRFARNLGDGRFGAHELLPEWPVGLAGATLADFDGDGNVELVQTTGRDAGYYRLDRRTRRWQSLRRFKSALNVGSAGGEVRQADLSGDGRADVVLFHASGITWFPNQGADGFGDPVELRLPAARMPAANLALDRFLADMTGDGLADIVEVLNGSVRYWPNLGRGCFGDPVAMDNAPRLDAEGSYDAARVVLVDLTSSGGADILYLRGNGVVYHAQNQRGGGFGPLEAIAWGSPIPNGVAPQVVDIYGDGSRAPVWAGVSPSGPAALHAMRLTSSPGARRVERVVHPLGATSEFEWGHSVRHYLRDMETGRGWDAPLPAQRAVVDVVRRSEPIDGGTQSEQFVYHDGHYDPRERGFAVFAIVDHFDIDTSSGPVLVAPLITRRFAHTGELDYASRFTQHHYSGDLEARPPPESFVEDAVLLSVDHEDALRALVGVGVREEIYAGDAFGASGEHPFRVSGSGQSVRVTRLADATYRTAIQLVPRQTLTALYEENPADPRESLKRALDIDAYLTPLRGVGAGLTRRAMFVEQPAQGHLLATASENVVRHIDETDRFELGIEVESRSFEVHVPDEADLFGASFGAELTVALASAQAYDDPLDPMGATLAARELIHERTYYWDSTQTEALPLARVGAVTLHHHSERSTYDRGQLTAVFGTNLDPDAELPARGFTVDGDVFYAKSTITRFTAAARFFRLDESEAYDGGIQRVVADGHDLAMASVTDEVGNVSLAEIDYHVLAPWRVTDANGAVREADYDPLGVTRRTSRYGTAMDEVGALVAHGFSALTRGATLPSLAAALADPETALGTAGSLLLYEFPVSGEPMRVLALTAEELVDRGPRASSVPARSQVDLTYVDGLGRLLQTRSLVEPGVAWIDDGSGGLVEAPAVTRWLVSGLVVYDAKQQQVGTYEPFFRDDHVFEGALSRRQFGVTTVTVYDALERVLETRLPNGTFSETRFEAWTEVSYDPNDSSDRAVAYIAARDTLPASDPERRALDQALSHAETPIRRQLDPLGRTVATVEVIEAGVELTESSILDIRGLSEATIDRRGLTISSRAFDRAGRQVLEVSADAGKRCSLFDATEREVQHWREDTEHRRTFDLAGRVTELTIVDSATSWLAERTTYGEGQPAAAERNQLGRLVRVEDGAGREETPRYGAFGEPLEVGRTLTAMPGLDPDWSGAVALEASGYKSIGAFDALGRRARAWLPDGTIREEEYLRSGPMRTLRATTPDGTARSVLADAVYNARGQEVSTTLGNGVETTNTYDPATFRLHRRLAVAPGGSTYQDLRHHYDPVGNLVYLDDLAQSPTATHVINGLTVNARREYRHDARYQLVEATGRVHRALTDPDFRGDVPTTGSFRGTRRLNLNDGTKVARYKRSYTYDAAGNLELWSHGPEGAGPGNSWNHELWVSPTSNRSYPAKDLNGINIPNPETRFNARGHINELPSVRAMHWSARDQLRRTLLVERPSDPDDEELYDYAADEKRLRKTTRRLVAGTVETTETLYLDGCELRRIAQGSTVILERWSAHAGDDDRLATIYFWDSDIWARETPDSAAVREHFHLGTKLGSVSLELDATAAMLSYEEHFPYGRTAFVAGDAVTEVAFRTRRFVGKDQDDATGFYSFQYRYYAPFIGNWVSPDPAGEIDGPNRYAYARNNPVTLVDSDGLQATSEDIPLTHAGQWGQAMRLAGLTPSGAMLESEVSEGNPDDHCVSSGGCADTGARAPAPSPAREESPPTGRFDAATAEVEPPSPESQDSQEAPRQFNAVTGDTDPLGPRSPSERGDSPRLGDDPDLLDRTLRLSEGQPTVDPFGANASVRVDLGGIPIPTGESDFPSLAQAAPGANGGSPPGVISESTVFNLSPQAEAGLLIAVGVVLIVFGVAILLASGGAATPGLAASFAAVGSLGGGTASVVLGSTGLGLNAVGAIDDPHLELLIESSATGLALAEPEVALLVPTVLAVGAPAGLEPEAAIQASTLVVGGVGAAHLGIHMARSAVRWLPIPVFGVGAGGPGVIFIRRARARRVIGDSNLLQDRPGALGARAIADDLLHDPSLEILIPQSVAQEIGLTSSQIRRLQDARARITIVPDPDILPFHAAQAAAPPGAPSLTSRRFGSNDALLAALAEQTGLPIVTANRRMVAQISNRQAAFPTARVRELGVDVTGREDVLP